MAMSLGEKIKSEKCQKERKKIGIMIDGLEKECQYCYREIDNSGLEGFRCTNRTAIKARGSSWCYPKNANEPCSICEYCKPKQNMEMTLDKAIAKIWHCIVSIRDCTGNKDFVEALELSVEIMRKYQKIEEIVGNYGFDTSWICLKKIREVIEGGNVD